MQLCHLNIEVSKRLQHQQHLLSGQTTWMEYTSTHNVVPKMNGGQQNSMELMKSQAFKLKTEEKEVWVLLID
jgi:hypothetical protein